MSSVEKINWQVLEEVLISDIDFVTNVVNKSVLGKAETLESDVEEGVISVNTFKEKMKFRETAFKSLLELITRYDIELRLQK
jgi:hypothetical protein